MARELKCKCCGKYMGILRDATVRTGMIVYCTPCDTLAGKAKAAAPGMPDFMRGLFRR